MTTEIPDPYTPPAISRFTGVFFCQYDPKDTAVMCGRVLEIVGNFAFIAEFDFDRHPDANKAPWMNSLTIATRDVSEYRLIPLDMLAGVTCRFFSTWEEMMPASVEVEKQLIVDALRRKGKKADPDPPCIPVTKW